MKKRRRERGGGVRGGEGGNYLSEEKIGQGTTQELGGEEKVEDSIEFGSGGGESVGSHFGRFDEQLEIVRERLETNGDEGN